MDKISVPTELFNRIAVYLQRQPYADVVQMLMDMQRAAQSPQPQPQPPIRMPPQPHGNGQPAEVKFE